MNHLIYWIKSYGYLGIFTSLTLGMFGLPVPNESIVTFTGFLVSKDYLHLVPAVLSAFLGCASGITLNYLLGRVVGLPLLLKYGHHLHITENKIDQAQRWFERHGKWVLVVGYFLPGVRHFTALSAGASRLQFWLFAPFAYAGGLLWVFSFLALGYFVGEEWYRLMPEIQKYLWVLVGVVVGLGFVVYMVHKIRRLDQASQAPRKKSS
jgi:membrane protein DedA with SNARE-associated domain